MASPPSNPQNIDLSDSAESVTRSPIPPFLHRIGLHEREFVVFDNGWRGWSYTYRELAGMADNLALHLHAHGLQKGDRVMICSENRPGYVAALWACLVNGIVIVPLELQSSAALAQRIETQVNPRALLLGDRAPKIEPGPHIAIFYLKELEATSPVNSFPPAAIRQDDTAELIFTSGTTAEPKGVIMTNRNLSACLQPIESQLAPYRRYLRYFAPLRILDLLPMSHLFGQVMTLFVIPILPGSVVFTESTNPEQIVSQISTRKICALISVPRILELLRTYLLHRFPETKEAPKQTGSWKKRWWRYRTVHRLFGWRFCCLVVGGAALSPEIEQFWSGLGFVVTQGYGLTETAPIVSFDNPFHAQRGTVGKPIAGLEIKLAPDGEILVRGDNVTPGYYQLPSETAAAFEDGWLRTGDLGRLDANGNLVILGRKKDLIVSADGRNIFPEDVERVLNKIDGVVESAIVGKDGVHAVLVLKSGAGAEEIIQQANAELESHQKIRSYSIWTQEALPRTTSTQKLRRAKILDDLKIGNPPEVISPTTVTDLLKRYAPGRTISSDTTLEQLGLSSLDRVDLMLEMEEKLNISIDDGALSSQTSVSNLSRPSAASKSIPEPAYSRRWFARLLRRILLPVIFLPLTRLFARVTVSGRSHLTAIETPVIFAANHQSYIDAAVILLSLPNRWRYRIAPAASTDFFDPYFSPHRYSIFKRLGKSLLYRFVTLLFNAFPLSQLETGTRRTLRYIGELVEEGWSILIFPEGHRTSTGAIEPFYPGVAMIALQMGLPVVPVRLVGVDRVWHRDAKLPHRGRVEVRFGAPLILKGKDYKTIARQVEEAVRNL